MLLRGLFSSCGERGLSSLQSVGSVVAIARLQSAGAGVVAHQLSCYMACGISQARGSSLCLLHWQVDSLPLSHQGSLVNFSVRSFLIQCIELRSFQFRSLEKNLPKEKNFLFEKH